MKSIYKKTIIMVSLFFCTILCLTSCSNRIYQIEILKSIDDLSCTSMELSNQDINNINNFLDNYYYEDTDYSGFISNTTNSIDLYTTYNIVRTSKLFNHEESLVYLKTSLSFLENSNVSSYDILNVLYYKYLCDEFNYDYNALEVRNVLNKYYDSNQFLFYLNSSMDSDSLKYSLSALCVEISGDLIHDLIPNMKDYAIQQLQKTEFVRNIDIALYSSGGAILYYCNVLGVDIILDNNQLSWFDYWKEIYESSFTCDIFYISSYIEFLKIAQLFDSNYSLDKINYYYSHCNENQIDSIEDLQFIYNSFKYVTNLSNNALNDLIKKKIDYIVTNVLFVRNISARSTAFGVALSKFTGFSYNEEKVQAYIKNEYNSLLSYDDNYYASEVLYYLVGTDSLINGLNSCMYDDINIQKIINVLLDSFNYGNKSSAKDIISIRYLVEIISSIQCHNGNVTLNQKQAKKIRSTLEYYCNDNLVQNSIFMVFLKRIDDRLGFSIISDDDMIKTISALHQNDGYKYTIEEDYPDVYSTFEVIKYLENSSLNLNNCNTNIRIDFNKSQYEMEKKLESLNVASLYLVYYTNNANLNTSAK